MSKNKSKKETKKYKEEEIMKGKSELKKKGNKYTVDTELNIKEGLEPKVKRALKKSIIDETNKKIKGYKKPVGFGFYSGSIDLDYGSSSSDDMKIVKKRGRPKKNGKGILEDMYDYFNPPSNFESWRERSQERQIQGARQREQIAQQDYERRIRQAQEELRKAQEERARREKSAKEYGVFQGDINNPINWDEPKEYDERQMMRKEDKPKRGRGRPRKYFK